MDLKSTALVLIGYQNDYFAEDGILHSVIEESTQSVLEKTISMITALLSTDMLMITTPINFTEDYSELLDPIGILKFIKDSGAFKVNSTGAQIIPEFKQFGERILEVPGKRGLNAFSDTDLDTVLKDYGITDLALAGAVTSICIDSTGRAAFEKDYKIIQLSDCTSGRTIVEQDFYCRNIFPLYASVQNSKEFLGNLGVNGT